MSGMRVVGTVEKNIRPDPANVVNVAANTSTDIFDDLSSTKYACIEMSARYLQNLTGGDLYYCVGQDCNANAGAKSYHGILSDRQQLDCSNHGARVSVFSVAGGDVSTLILRRRDLSEHVTILPSDQLGVQ